MPNANIPAGARPYGRVEQMTTYKAESTIYKGDFCKKNANGTVERAAATNPVVGVALSSAAAGESVLMADHPEQKFVVQAAGSSVAAQTNLGLNADISAGTANTTYKRSGMQLDDSTLATTSTLVLRLIAIEPAVDNALGANAKCIVKINQHQNAPAVAGV